MRVRRPSPTWVETRSVPSGNWGRVLPNRGTSKGQQQGTPWITLFFGIVLLSMVGLIACGASDDLRPAPDFQFTLYQGDEVLGGNEMMLSDLRGKPVVLNFWAGLCPPCRLEMPDFQQFYDEFSDRITLLGLDVGPFLIGLGTTQDAKDLLKELDVSYPAGYPANDNAPRDYEVVGMPCTFFITADGKIFRKWCAGILTKAKLSEIAEQMLTPS